VVHVAWADVQAYATWAGKELPTEAEWELACRGELDGAEFAWGDELNPEGRWMANTWQGEFPNENLELDGYAGTAPVGRYPANGYGLHDMIGNVWEWTSDWYQPHGDAAHGCCTPVNPRGGDREHSRHPGDAAAIPRKVMKGGSHLCAPKLLPALPTGRPHGPGGRHRHLPPRVPVHRQARGRWRRRLTRRRPGTTPGPGRPSSGSSRP
jgi:sulfatase modifying factor 1